MGVVSGMLCKPVLPEQTETGGSLELGGWPAAFFRFSERPCLRGIRWRVVDCGTSGPCHHTEELVRLKLQGIFELRTVGVGPAPCQTT